MSCSQDQHLIQALKGTGNEENNEFSDHSQVFSIFLFRELANKGPFAANGHMVQNPPYWRESNALGHPKQRTFKFYWMKSLCFGCPSA